MSSILAVAIAMVAGLLFSKLAKFAKLPDITGYLIAGIIVGPSVLGPYIGGWSQTGPNTLEAISFISEMALGLIAFNIGMSFKFSVLKKIGKKISIITICEALGAVLITMSMLAIVMLCGLPIDISIIFTLGAISAATAPAATLMIIKQYKAKGSVVNTLLPVVAFDDGIALILFAIFFSLAKGFAGVEAITAMDVIVFPLLEIIASITLGIVLGLVLMGACKLFSSKENRFMSTIAIILVNIGICVTINHVANIDFEMSSLLSCMALGATFCNTCKDFERIFNDVDKITPPIYMLFFVISGAHLNFSIFTNSSIVVVVVVTALVYLVFRCVGKYTGAYIGTTITKCEPQVRKYLGFTLFPQAGVAIGLATTASLSFSSMGVESLITAGEVILAIVLLCTLVYELFGPVITKIALIKSGDIVLNEQSGPACDI